MAAKKKASKKAVKKAATKTSGAPKKVGIAVREGGIGNVIVAGIKAKKDNEAILKDVKKKFKDAKTTSACVSWYRSKLNKQ